MKVGTKLVFLGHHGSQSVVTNFYYRIIRFYPDKDTVVIGEWYTPHRVIGHYKTNILKSRFIEVIEIK